MLCAIWCVGRVACRCGLRPATVRYRDLASSRTCCRMQLRAATKPTDAASHFCANHQKKVQSIKVVPNDSRGACSSGLYFLPFETSGAASCGAPGSKASGQCFEALRFSLAKVSWSGCQCRTVQQTLHAKEKQKMPCRTCVDCAIFFRFAYKLNFMKLDELGGLKTPKTKLQHFQAKHAEKRRST